MFRAYATLGLVLAALANLAGCTATTGDDSMFIVNNTAPPTGMCVFTGAAGQPFISNGTIDTNTRAGYQFTPLVQSEIVAPMGTEAAHTIEVLGANIDLAVVGTADGSSVSLPSADQHFSSLTSGSLTPNGGTANFSLQIVPLDAIAAIKAATMADVTLDATIKLYGRLGGNKVTARPFDYPLTVCTGCLVTDAGPCSDTVKPAATNPCQPYQDSPVDCCEQGSGGSLLCP